MLVKPMVGSWELPRIEGISSREERRRAVLRVPGLQGDLHQDLGRGSMVVEIVGSLAGDEARDDFLKEVREKFLAGDPVDFVADIANESELERVLIDALEVSEVAGSPDAFRYRVVLREYVEPPEPPGLGADLGAELGLELDDLASLGLDLLDLPAILTTVPDLSDLLSPVKTAAEDLKKTLSQGGAVLSPLKGLLGG